MNLHLLLPLLIWAAVPATGQTSEFVFEPVASHPRCHAATAVELDDGTLVAAWFAGENEGSKDQAIFSSRKPAGGRWSEPRIIFDTPGVADFNPVLLYDGARLHLFVVRAATGVDPHGSLWQLTSGDGGNTWSGAVCVLDKEGFWGRNAPVRAGARWVIPVSDVQSRGSRVLISEDLKNYRPSPLVSAEHYLSQPAVAWLGGARLAAVFRDRTKPGGSVWFAGSDDFGDSWSAPRKTRFSNPDSGIALLALPGGRLLLVHNHSETRRTPLNIALSTDGGANWSDGPVLEREAGEYSYPAAILGRDGTVHIFYTWKRTHIRHYASPQTHF
jgi:predicted neuraminidase